MRGKLGERLLGGDGFRIIPAHAGQTLQSDSHNVCCADHPRTCGANTLSVWLAFVAYGSSPHMRGKLRVYRSTFAMPRIIPAHTGQTRTATTRRGQPSDHPRTCGANTAAGKAKLYNAGSSPHMRGKRGGARLRGLAGRIIPAHAGQTPTASFFRGSLADHPRTCGANVLRGDLHHKDFGSSPHMRGKHSTVSFHAMRVRIIPAHAGQTTCMFPPSLATSDHPRTCGANAGSICHWPIARGSSPHMRGKRRVLLWLPGYGRIIPAHAGQTCPLV